MSEKTYPFELFKGGESKKVENSGQEARARIEGFCEPYKYQEFPKCLYKDGKREVHEVSGDQVSGEERVVNNPEEEQAARASGFRMLGEAAPEVVEKEDAKGQAKAKKAA